MSLFPKTRFLNNYLLIVLTLLLFTACKVNSVDSLNTPADLLAEGKVKMNKKMYEDSIEYFNATINRFPNSPQAIESELLKADAYYQDREYIDAQFAYSTFKQLHPEHEKIEYVTLQLAKSHGKQAKKAAAKDQSETQKSLIYVNELLNNSADAETVAEATELQKQAYEKLYAKELHIGRFYFKQKQYPAAIGRLEPIADDITYPKLYVQARYFLAKAYARNDSPAQAKLMVDSMDADTLKQAKPAWRKRLLKLKHKLSVKN